MSKRFKRRDGVTVTIHDANERGISAYHRSDGTSGSIFPGKRKDFVKQEKAVTVNVLTTNEEEEPLSVGQLFFSELEQRMQKQDEERLRAWQNHRRELAAEIEDSGEEPLPIPTLNFERRTK
jgi:hypothetical protein